VVSARSAYEPIADGNGDIVYPGFELGVEIDAFSKYPASYTILSVWNPNGRPWLYWCSVQDFYRGAVYNDSAWDDTTFSTKDMDFVVKLNPGFTNTAETELQAYQARGGKVLAYHGRSEATTMMMMRG
jgi:feruloyl esterase